MTNVPSRRRFLQDVAGGTCLTTLGAGTAVELGLTRPALAEQLDAKQLDGELTFGELEPLVCLLQETPLDRLQGELVSQLSRGLPLKTLTAAGGARERANLWRRGQQRASYLHGALAGAADEFSVAARRRGVAGTQSFVSQYETHSGVWGQ